MVNEMGDKEFSVRDYFGEMQVVSIGSAVVIASHPANMMTIEFMTKNQISHECVACVAWFNERGDLCRDEFSLDCLRLAWNAISNGTL